MKLLKFALLFIASFCAYAQDDGEAIASLGNFNVSSQELQRVLSELSPAERRKLVANRSALEELIWQRIAWKALLKSSASEGWSESQEVRAQVEKAVEDLRDRITTTTYLQEKAKVPDSYPSDSEIREEFARMNPPPFIPAIFQVAQILIARPKVDLKDEMDRARSKAEELARRAHSESFEALAKEFSEDFVTKQNGGRLVPMPLEKMSPAMKASVKSMTVGEVSTPVETLRGWLIYKLISVEEERTLGIEEVAPVLRESMRRDSARKREREYLEIIAPRNDFMVNELVLREALHGLE